VRFTASVVIRAPVEAVFAFHERPEALERLIPPWEPSTIVTPPSSLLPGTVVEVDTRVGPIRHRVVAEHTEYEKNVRFVDEMRRGPFRRWRHEHRFEPHVDGCLLTDAIEYEAPLGILGRLVDPFVVRPRLRKMFEYRHRVTKAVLETARPGADGSR